MPKTAVDLDIPTAPAERVRRQDAYDAATLDGLRRQVDKYGLALMMIREGCADPKGVAGNALANPQVSAPVERVRNRIDIRLNDWLCEMRPNEDDSIVGFNEAWNIVRAVFSDELAGK